MIPVPTGARVSLATGYTDMRRGVPSLALQVQEVLRKDPLSGHLFVFRGRRSDLVKVIWHDGKGTCLFTKRLERGGSSGLRLRGCSDDLAGADELPIIRNRLAQPARNPASHADSRFGLESAASFDLLAHDIEAGRLPSDLVSALAALQAEREARLRAEAMAASAQAELSDDAALIAHLELRIEKLKRELYGQRSERTSRLIEQLELELEELVTTASEDELAAQAAAAKALEVRAFTRKRPVRKPWPDDIEHERVIIEAPTTCACCGGSRLARIGEDVTKTLEEIPRRFKVV